MPYLSLRIPVTTDVYNGNVYLSTCDRTGLDYTVCALTAAKAREKLRAELTTALQQHSSAMRHDRRLMIVTGEGVVLLVEYYNGGYGYSIWRGPARKVSNAACGFSGSILPPSETFDEVCERARRHAQQCYGGVAWECR